MEQHSSSEELRGYVCGEGRLNEFETKIAVCVNVGAHVSLLSVEKKKHSNYSSHIQGNFLAALIRRMPNDNMCVLATEADMQVRWLISAQTSQSSL